MSNKKRGPSYSHQEVESLLGLVAEELPIGQEDWESVCSQHILIWDNLGRDYLSLRRKFNQLAGKKVPTGDPNCPPQVREAKRILAMIKEKAEIEVFSGSEEPEDDRAPEIDDTAPAATVATRENANDNNSSVSQTSVSTTPPTVSPKLKRVSHPKKSGSNAGLCNYAVLGQNCVITHPHIKQYNFP